MSFLGSVVGSAAQGAASSGGSSAAGSAGASSTGSVAGQGLSGSLGSAYGSSGAGSGAAASSPTYGMASPSVGPTLDSANAMNASKGFWPDLGESIGMFGKNYAEGYSQPFSGELGMNANTLGSVMRMSGGDSASNSLSAYLQAERDRKRQRGY